ncbi:hypothetical protein CS022_16530 [Veronia nyctiphanis]|uniref:Uncharacterized protein n=1 Tax=Veronia nyctiphanis TaxID=1278244 RepID=A0A4Q0YQI3_9GAMM|nr:hypothetical protein CS022_16530 [Veronia nyctiphanis]
MVNFLVVSKKFKLNKLLYSLDFLFFLNFLKPLLPAFSLFSPTLLDPFHIVTLQEFRDQFKGLNLKVLPFA